MFLLKKYKLYKKDLHINLYKLHLTLFLLYITFTNFHILYIVHFNT